MPVGTDGVLLGAWTAAQLHAADAAPCRLLDVGTGTGLLALMLAQALPHALVEAIEIDPAAAAQARQNVSASPWADRVTVHALALADYAARLAPAEDRFDLIISNPPFYDATLKPADAMRAAARHNDALTWEALMRFSALHLAPAGWLSLVFPTAASGSVLTAATLAGLAPVRLTDVTTRLGKPPKRTLAAFGRRAVAPQRSALALTDAAGCPTAAYRALTADYYLW